MVPDWEKHLNRLNRRKQIISKISRIFALSMLLCLGIWVLWPERSPNVPEEYSIYDDSIIVIDDSAAIKISSSAGGIAIYFDDAQSEVK